MVKENAFFYLLQLLCALIQYMHLCACRFFSWICVCNTKYWSDLLCQGHCSQTIWCHDGVMLSSFPRIQCKPAEGKRYTLKYSGKTGIEFDEIIGYDIIWVQKKTFSNYDAWQPLYLEQRTRCFLWKMKIDSLDVGDIDTHLFKKKERWFIPEAGK